MTTLTATAETLKAAIAALKDGDILKLTGAFAPFRASNLAFANEVVIDATEAEITEWYWTNISGVRFIGGTWLSGSTAYTSGLRIDKARRISILGGEYFGATRLGLTPNGYGVVFNGGYDIDAGLYLGSDISVEEARFEGMKVGAVFSKLERALIAKGVFRGSRSDAVNFAQCKGFTARGNDVRETYITSTEHPDAFQAWSRPDAPPACNGLIEDNVVDGLMQGIGMFNHTRNVAAGRRVFDGYVDGKATFRTLTVDEMINDGGFDDITIRRNKINGGYPHGIALNHGRRVTVTDNSVSTCEGAAYQANINLTDIVDLTRHGNTVAAWGSKPAKDDPPIVVDTPPTEPVDPHVAEIEALKAQVAILTAEKSSLTDRLAQAALLASELRAAVTALEDRVDRLLVERATSLTLAKQARAARAKNIWLDQLIALLSAPAP